MTKVKTFGTVAGRAIVIQADIRLDDDLDLSRLGARQVCTDLRDAINATIEQFIEDNLYEDSRYLVNGDRD